MRPWKLQIIEKPSEMETVEELQRIVWSGGETEVVPIHMLVAAVNNGGLIIGAYQESSHQPDNPNLVGFVFGFPGIYFTPDGPQLKHCSHMLAVLPEYRDQGLGFILKRAQWQMVRHQGLNRITWTYDPLLSRNAHLNMAKLGAVCNTYRRDVYGDMRDDLNRGLPSDRFEVDWWINTKRVERRLSRRVRRKLDLAHFLSAGAELVNPSRLEGQLPYPSPLAGSFPEKHLLLVEIPPDFQALKEVDPGLGLSWRMHIREIFEELFARGYLVIDFVYLSGTSPRSFYVVSLGDITL